MTRGGTLRGLVGVGLLVALSGSGPAVAVGGGAAGGTAATSMPAVDAATACSSGTRACPIRISFAPGAYSGQGRTQLHGVGSTRWFVVRARAGQSMIVLVEGTGPTRGVVSFPNGRSSGQPGGRVFDGFVLASGDARIRVTESPMGQAWAGPVDVVVVIY